MADLDAALLQEILDVAQGQREPDIHHDCQADDFRAGLELAKGAAFCHVRRLSDRQPPRKNFALTVPPGRLGRSPPIGSATAMCVTLKLPESERKWQDRFVSRAAKRGSMTNSTRLRCPICTRPSGLMNAARRPSNGTLDRKAKSSDLAASGSLLGECRSSPGSTKNCKNVTHPNL